MSKPIKKLDLKRETVKALKVRANIRTGFDLAGAADVGNKVDVAKVTLLQNGLVAVGGMHDPFSDAGQSGGPRSGPHGQY